MHALLLVDLQYDFLPGGALAVAQGDQVIDIARDRASKFELVVATQDWHPADHLSFASQHPGHSVGDIVELEGVSQILWPDHCVQQTRGAELVDAVATLPQHVVQKGTHRHLDSYSGFFDNDHRQATGLDAWLREHSVKRLSIMGLATDYCVKFTVLDALELGYATTLLVEGCRGVDLNPGDVEQAIQEMAERGAVLA